MLKVKLLGEKIMYTIFYCFVLGLFEALKQSFSRKNLVPVEKLDIKFDTTGVPEVNPCRINSRCVMSSFSICRAKR